MLKQGLSQKLLQKLSPQQIQFIQLLQLNTTELEKRIEEELTENPALENDKSETEGSSDGEDDLYESSSESESGDDLEADVDTDDFNDDYDMDLSDYMGDEGDDYNYNGGAESDEDKKDLPFATTNTLYDVLMEQLNAVRLNERGKELGRHLIGMIEEDGYLRRPLKNIVYDLAFLNQIQTTEEELEKVLKIIQSMDPPGIGARSLEECLMIQLDKKEPQTEHVRMAKRIIHEYMDDLAKRHYERLMKALHIDRDELKDVIEIITHLNPKPGESQVNVKTQYIIPDFMVTNAEGMLQVSLNSRNAPELRISREYQETIKGYQESNIKNKDLKNQVQFIKQKLDGAKWFIDAIKQRQNTLLQTMRTIVEFQKEFFITGDIEKLQPMILKDIADRIGMDISTVSRVANSKYVQTDFGIYSLKEFFSEGIQTESGEEVSNREVKQILKDYIENESKKRPLTDEKLTDLLNEKGYNIARRTVAKYREQLNIPVARLRKEI
jgi:RNA polymerase sigma-54 factor